MAAIKGREAATLASHDKVLALAAPYHGTATETELDLFYRIFPLDAAMCASDAPQLLESDDDNMARQAAERLLESGHGAEVWLGSRLILRSPPPGTSAESALDQNGGISGRADGSVQSVTGCRPSV